MNKDNIICLPHKDLRKPSIKVSFIDEEIIKLTTDMESATLDWEDSRPHEVGVALAAPQIDVLKRVIVIRNDFDNKNDRSFSVLINPEITKLEGDLITDYEGCLSIKNIYGKVERFNKIRLKATGLDGKEVRIKAEGFLARVLQHEIDHTKGIVFIDHIKDSPDSFYKLTDSGKLEKLDYEKDIKQNSILW